MKKNVIFDLDGTLLNTLEDLADSCNETLRLMNFPPREISEVKNFVGNGIAKLMERALPPGEEKKSDEAASLMKKIYAENCMKKTKPYDGIRELLDELFLRKIKIAVVSNKPDLQVKRLTEFYFSGRILTENALGDADGRKRKPSPDSLLFDSDVDVETAKNAGVDCASAVWGFRSEKFLLAHGAKIIVQNPLEILELL
jgi:phosphoglycolate phosphatase